MKDITLDSYKLLFNTNSKDLLISFGSRGVVKFAQNNYLKNIEINQLHCVDSDGSSWYQNGVKDMANNIFGLAEYIKNICKKYGFEKIFCIGASMGAYAALAIGALLNAHKVIAISPQIILHHGWPFAPKKNVDLKLKSIKDIIERAYNTQFIVITSSELIDVYHASLIHKLDNVYISILKSPHNVLKMLKQSNFLDSFLNSILTFKKIDDLGITGINIKLTQSQKDLSDFLNLYYKKNYNDAIPHIKRLVLMNPDWLDAQKLLANILFNRGEYKDSFILYSLLSDKLPDDLDIIRNLIHIVSIHSVENSNFQLLLDKLLFLNSMNNISSVDTLVDLADRATKIKNHKLSVHVRSLLNKEYNIEDYLNYYQLGRSFQNLKNIEDARTCYIKVVNLQEKVLSKDYWIIEKSQERLNKIELSGN